MRQHFILAALLLATNAMAAGEPLMVDRGIRGEFRHCKYGDGKVYAVWATSTCPATAPEVSNDGKGTGFFRSIIIEGSAKRCVYRVGSVDREITIHINDNCPINHEF